MAGEFPAQIASNAENASIWWRHYNTRIEADETIPKAGWLLQYICIWAQRFRSCLVYKFS